MVRDDKYKNYYIKSTFEELGRLKLSDDKNIVISKKISVSGESYSITQAVRIIPQGKSEEVEIFYPYALNLSKIQLKEFAIKLLDIL